MLRRILSTALVVLGAALAAHAAAAATIAVGPYTPSTTAPFIVPIEVTGAVDLASFTFDLAFDPSSVMIDTACDPSGDPFCDFTTGPVTVGTFYTDAAAFTPLFLPGFILLDASGNQTGQLVGVQGAWQDSGPAPSGSGVLAFVEFVAASGGDLAVPITVVGQPASGATVPEPSTLALAGIACLVVAFGRRRAAARWSRTARARAPAPRRLVLLPRGGNSRMNRALRAARFLGLAAVLVGGPASAQMGNGPYYASPSWDQTLPATTRFVVLTNFANEAVLDRETGLVWERTPNRAVQTYADAYDRCVIVTTGGRLGWRLPSVYELASLMDPSVTSGAPFPPGHPFSVPAANGLGYWTTTAVAFALGTDFRYEFLAWEVGDDGLTHRTHGSVNATGAGAAAWCVRGPGDAGRGF